jgi:enterobacterial common antigen flippase
MGFIIVAQARQAIFFACELVWSVVSLGMAWGCVKMFGLNGAGLAFFLSYVFHLFLIYPIVRKLSGFRWSQINRRTGTLQLLMIGTVFVSFYALPLIAAVCVGVAGTGLGCWYSIRTLSRLVPLDEIPRPVRRALTGLGVLRPGPTIVAAP